MKATYLICLLVSSLLTVDVFAGKPAPKPASDLECTGCVGTTDIEDGAVTTQKLSAEVNALLNTIGQLQTRIETLEAQHPTPVVKVYVGDTLLGYRSLSAIGGGGGGVFLYEPVTGSFLTLGVNTDGGTSTYDIAKIDIEYESFDCTGTGLVLTGGASDTRNVLIGNGSDFYRTTGTYVRPPPLLINSRKPSATGICRTTTNSRLNEGLSAVEAVPYPLPYSLPFIAPAPGGLRMEYVAP
jgi:hypothetical protein